jgi:glycosyltransferase involved in cell wall biosynthesis
VISVVIPVLDGRDGLPSTLDALVDQHGVDDVEVLVVDNGSTDGTPEIAARHRIAPKVLHESARGPYAARNLGIDAASGEVVAFTDADCRPEPDWLAAGVAAVDAGADLVAGSIVQEPTGPQPSLWERYDRATYLRQDQYVTGQGFGATANLFVRRAVFDAIGPFRPELVASGDLEFGRRATAAGFRLVYAAGARVRHRPRTTARDTWRLHRKLGSGFAELARAGLRERPWRDPALRLPLQEVAWLVSRDGEYVRRRRLAPVHGLVLAARWTGRLTGRG